jgi:hypothetical protein
VNDIKLKPAFGWNLLFAVSLLAILGTIWYGFLRPTQPGQASSWKKTLDDLTAQSRTANDAAAADLAVVDNRTWDQSLDNLGSTVLGNLTRLAEKHKLQLSNFRTERPSGLANLSEAPFVLVVDGAFPDVLTFVQSVESPGNKLAVSLLQLSASDAVPGNVTATMGLSGFRKEGI